MFSDLAIPAFIAGVLMFLAPCTLPLVPGFLAFIGGVSAHGADAHAEPARVLQARLLRNALFYVLGFSTVFVLLGTGFAALGRHGLNGFQSTLQRISGALILLLGLYLARVFDHPRLRFLDRSFHAGFASRLAPGKASSAFLFGATFALGWSPCIGPILGSILLLASSSSTVVQGAVLLSIFSLGLGLPFLLVAALAGKATGAIKHIVRFTPTISRIGGILIALMGFFILSGDLGTWTGFFYRLFRFVPYERLLDYY